MSAPDAETAAAGWYPDPYAQATYRWFDGAVWTAQVHDVTPVAPAVPPAATSVPFVADPTLGSTTTAGYSAAGASTASGSRFGTPTYTDQTVHGGTLGCLMPQQYGGAIVGCVWARSGTGVIVVACMK